MNFDDRSQTILFKVKLYKRLKFNNNTFALFFFVFVYQDTDPMCPINNLIDFPSVSLFERIYHILIYILTGSLLLSNRLQILRLILSKFKRSD